MIIARCFANKWNNEKSKSILLELALEYEKKSWKEDWINPFVKEVFKDDPDWLKIYLDNQMKNFEDKGNYEWFIWYFEWLSDWFFRWIYEQLGAYASILDWDAQKKIFSGWV
jgi:hypothetical protein